VYMFVVNFLWWTSATNSGWKTKMVDIVVANKSSFWDTV